MARIDALLGALLKDNGSDLHLSTGAPPMARIHGDMVPIGDVILTAEDTANILREIMPEGAFESLATGSEADFCHPVQGVGRFRINAFLDHHGTAAVLRYVPEKVSSFEQLGLPPAVKALCGLSRGLVLVTGPTGSGKSTTLAAMIDEINRTRTEHIITIEDPIEFVHVNKRCLVNQRQIGSHSRSFAHALRAALREDPDVILVGEMRDLGTMAAALEAAETGHLVLGTMHTSSAGGAIDRIVDQFPQGTQMQARTQLASSLQGVVAQTLVKRKDMKGRVPAVEILVSTSGIAAQIREGKTHQLTSAIQTGGRLGMTTMNDSLIKLVSRGITEAVEAYEAASDKESLLRGFQVANISLDHSTLRGSTGAAPPALTPERSRA